MKKKILISLIIIIVLVAVSVGGVLGYLKFKAGKSGLIGQVLNNQPVNRYIKHKVDPADAEKYRGAVANLADGWKQYANQGWGISFKFRDPADQIVVQDGRYNINISTKRWIEVLHSKEDYDYLYKKYKDEIQSISMDKLCGFLSDYPNLGEYVKSDWNGYQGSAELISIDEIVNDNGVKLYKAVADVSHGMQSPEAFRVIRYYVQYPSEIIQDEKLGLACDLIEFRGDELLNEDIIESLRFIK